MNHPPSNRRTYNEHRTYVIPPAPQAAVAVAGSTKTFPVRRIWCVGRNYLEHIRRWAMTSASRRSSLPSPPTRSCHDGGTVPYPPLTNDLHHEVEMVVALKSGGRNIPKDKALDCVWGYGVGIDLTRRDLQIASRNIKRPWEIGKAFDGSAPCGPLSPRREIGHPAKGRIHLKVNGEVKQDGDLEQMIWNVPEVDLEALRDGRARARRHHHDRHARRRSARSRPATSSNARSRASASSVTIGPKL